MVAAAPSNGDIRRARIDYSESRVSGVIDFVALERPDARVVMGFDLRWQDAIQYNYGGVLVFASARRPGGFARFGGDPSCQVEHHIDYARDRVTLSLPSRCLDDPPWIQAFAAASVRARYAGAAAWLDSAPDAFHYGRRIPRG